MQSLSIKTLAIAFLIVFCSKLMAQTDRGFALYGEGTERPAPEARAVRPITAPFFNEDAFITTDLRAWYIYHEFGSIDGEFNSGALQVRVALADNFQFVAYKNGYSDFSGTDIAALNDGWNDVGLGLKYALFQDYGSQTHIAVGLGYEFGVGDDQVLQDSDEFRLWISGNKGFGNLHLGGTANFILAEDNGDSLVGNSDLFTLHFHADYYVNQYFSPVVEVNGYFVSDEGSTGLPFSGVDIVSAGGGEDNHTLTYALGFEARPIELLGLRLAYETQLNNSEESLFGQRWSFSAVYEF